MFWLPTRTAHITGIEAVRLAGKGFSASNSQTSCSTSPREMDETNIIFLGHPLLFNTVVHIIWLTHLETTGPSCFLLSNLLLKTPLTAVRYGIAQLHYCKIILSCSHLVKNYRQKDQHNFGRFRMHSIIHCYEIHGIWLNIFVEIPCTHWMIFWRQSFSEKPDLAAAPAVFCSNFTASSSIFFHYRFKLMNRKAYKSPRNSLMTL